MAQQDNTTFCLPLPLPNGTNEINVPCPKACLSFHVLEAGYSTSNKLPLVLLLHGYPELAFSRRKVMPQLAHAGYCVVAPDQRGYGRTTGWDTSSYETVDLAQFTLTNLVRDLVILINALGYREVACVVGHDFGAASAAMCAVIRRPDIFKSVILMSHPFSGMPSLPFNTAHNIHKPAATSALAGVNISDQLANLPQPRKHYKWDNSKPKAADEWNNPPQGLNDFLRGYFYVKSANWPGNNPHPLLSWTADELAKMPYYYIMPLQHSMPTAEWTRTGFQGGLNWYRTTSSPEYTQDLDLFATKKIEVPARFISGPKDWGNYQQPGALDKMADACPKFRGVIFIKDAGHWPQQEQPERVSEHVPRFLEEIRCDSVPARLLKHSE